MMRTTIRWMLTDANYVRRYVPAGWAGFSVLYGLLGWIRTAIIGPASCFMASTFAGDGDLP